VEKAHKNVLNILLQVLDDGRLTDSTGKTVDFTNTIIILTSNVGAEYLLQANDGSARDNVMNMVRRHFRPEFLNRVDEVVLFEPLTQEHARKILSIQFKEIQNRLAEQHITIEATEEALNKLAKEGFDPLYGGRPMKRVLQRVVLNELSKSILSGKIQKESAVLMDVDKEGNLTFENVVVEI
jgi:ATP-dependent Clp protease ATP-binding subunit ClpB